MSRLDVQPNSLLLCGYWVLGVRQPRLTTHLLLMPRLRDSGGIPLLPLHAFMICTRTYSPFNYQFTRQQHQNWRKATMMMMMMMVTIQHWQCSTGCINISITIRLTNLFRKFIKIHALTCLFPHFLLDNHYFGHTNAGITVVTYCCLNVY